jgi:hypothetical protein
MRRQAIDIARVGRLRALKRLQGRPLTERTVRVTSDWTSGRSKVLHEDTLNRMLAYYDNVVCLPNTAKRHLMARGIG